MQPDREWTAPQVASQGKDGKDAGRLWDFAVMRMQYAEVQPFGVGAYLLLSAGFSRELRNTGLHCC